MIFNVEQYDVVKAINENTLTGSFEGAVRINEIGGKSEQSKTPSLNDPQEIKSVVVSKLKTGTKNLLDCRDLKQRIDNGITYTPVYDENNNLLYVEAKGTASANSSYSLNESYVVTEESIFSGCPKGGNSDSTFFMAVGGVGHDYGEGLKVSPSTTARWVGIGIRSGYTAVNLRFYPMIRPVSMTDATYEPHKESEVTLSESITLNGVGNVKDCIVRKNGVLGVVRKVKSVRLDSSLTWLINVAGRRIYTDLITSGFSKSVDSSLILCTHAVGGTWADDKKGTICVGNGQISCVGFSTQDFPTVEELKTWLDTQTGGVFVIAPLATYSFEPLPEVDQIALNNLQSFNGVTHLSVNSEVEANTEVEFGVSKTGAYVLTALNGYEKDCIKSELKEVDCTVYSGFFAETSWCKCVKVGNVVTLTYYLVALTDRNIPMTAITNLPKEVTGLAYPVRSMAFNKTKLSVIETTISGGTLSVGADMNTPISANDVITGSITYMTLG